MNRSFNIALGLLVGGLLIPLSLSGQPETDWPCIQRKVPQLSVGQMWPYLVEPTPETTEAKDLPELVEVRRLVAQLSLRRVSLEEAKGLVEAFVQERAARDLPALNENDWGRIFEAVLFEINQQRRRLIDGIERYTKAQRAGSRTVEDLRGELAIALAAEPADFDLIDDLEARLDWQERVHRERESALSYVCETPVLLEKRAFALAKILLSQFKRE